MVEICVIMRYQKTVIGVTRTRSDGCLRVSSAESGAACLVSRAKSST